MEKQMWEMGLDEDSICEVCDSLLLLDEVVCVWCCLEIFDQFDNQDNGQMLEVEKKLNE